MDWLSAVEGIAGSIVPLLDKMPAVRAGLGFAMVFFLPGFAWTLVFFHGREVSIVERLALSVGLSIALVALSMLAVNKLFEVSVTGFNAVLVILVITGIPVIFYCFKRLATQRRNDRESRGP